MEIRNLLDTKCKTLVIKMLKELNEDLNSIKMIQLETKDILWNKDNIQRNNNRVHEAENQINDLEHIEAKTTNQNDNKKKNPPKMSIV